MQKIFIGNDHTGVDLKKYLVKFLTDKGYQVINLGTDNDSSVDYPDFGAKVGTMVASNSNCFGVIICGTGIGISIAANKINGVRAALCYEQATAQLAREHNDANILALGARIIANERAAEIVMTFLTTTFAAGRHLNRINKITLLESKNN